MQKNKLGFSRYEVLIFEIRGARCEVLIFEIRGTRCEVRDYLARPPLPPNYSRTSYLAPRTSKKPRTSYLDS